jgi:hypothetical protein
VPISRPWASCTATSRARRSQCACWPIATPWKVAAKYPEDHEAQIFYALALAASEDPADKTYAGRLKAGAILEKLFEEEPTHPGLAHYIIHAYDVPALSEQALVAARRYAEIAPDAPHALHMPSHTFTRLDSPAIWRPTGAVGQTRKFIGSKRLLRS